MSLHLLPTRHGGAAENMAVDFLLLQRYPAAAARFRHYGWHRPAFTFGYAQKITFVREQVAACADPAGVRVELCRRPTGGGLVDHRVDWTYALVIPRGHPLEALRATESYRLVHESLAEALRAQGIAAVTKRTHDPDTPEADSAGEPQPERTGAGRGICFQHAEIYDVVNRDNGRKIAGAAQKRNKHGLLFQGSILRPEAGGESTDWDLFQETFAARLGAGLQLPVEPVPWPEFDEDEVAALTEQYSSAEWLEFR